LLFLFPGLHLRKQPRPPIGARRRFAAIAASVAQGATVI
jgi:hypothetical protein